MNNSIHGFGNSDNPYNLRDRIGSFGTFKAKDSLPLEYIQLTLTVEELDCLTLHRDLKSSQERNFDLLLQRDIDEEKVEKAKQYLSTENNKADRTPFFPPLLAAILPFQKNEMEPYYSNEESSTDDVTLKRVWKDQFCIEYALGNGADAYLVPATSSSKDKTEDVEVQRSAARFSARVLRADSINKGVRLVVIDGQHRLETLRRVNADDPELLLRTQVPVCIIYAPKATPFHGEKALLAQSKMPEVKDTFRKLFLDVNSKSTSVSGHFHALLNDTAAYGLAVRKFCDFVITEKGPQALAAIEWNVRKDKESKEISRFYSITSIGVLAPLINTILERYGYYLLNIIAIQQKLGESDQNFDDLENLTYTQKKPIEDAIERNIIPILNSIFFKTNEYCRLIAAFNEQLGWLDEMHAKASGTEKLHYSRYKASILEYHPVSGLDKLASEGFEDVKNKFSARITQAYSTDGHSTIAQKLVFQRGMFDALLALLEVGKEFNLDPVKLGDAFAGLLNAALENKAGRFSPEREYLQNLLYDKSAIIQTVGAHKAVASLILAHLGRKEVASDFANTVSSEAISRQQISDRLQGAGQQRAQALIELYEVQLKKSFIKNYKSDPKLSDSQKQELEELQRARDLDKAKAKNKEIPRNKIDNRFEAKVAEKLKQHVEAARLDLQFQLGYTTEIVVDQIDDDATPASDEVNGK